MKDFLDTLINRYPTLGPIKDDIQSAFEILKQSYSVGGKLLLTGNGGSCSDTDHIVGELMKGFMLKRPLGADLKESICKIDPQEGGELCRSLQMGLPAISLSAHNALNTAFINDAYRGGDFFYAQQIVGYGNPNDVFLGISTSGNSKDVVYAAEVAKAMGLKTIALTGKFGGKLSSIVDCAIRAPETETFAVQELHLPIYHCLCMMLEDYFYGDANGK